MANPTQGFKLSPNISSTYKPAAPTRLDVVDGRTLVGEADTDATLRGMKAGAALAEGLLGSIDFKGLFDPAEKAKREAALAEANFKLKNRELFEKVATTGALGELALNNAQLEALGLEGLNPFQLDLEGKALDVKKKSILTDSIAKTQPIQDELLVNELTAALGRQPTEAEVAKAKLEAEQKNLKFDESIRSDKEGLVKDDIETTKASNQAVKDALKSDTTAPTATTDQGAMKLPPKPKERIFDPYTKSFKTNPEYTKWLELKTFSEKEAMKNSMPDPEKEVLDFGYVKTKDDAKKAKDTYMNVEAILSNISDMRDLHGGEEGVGTEIPLTEKGELLSQKAAQIKGILKDVLKLGVLSKTDFEFLDRQVPDPTTWKANIKGAIGIDNTQALLNGLERDVQRRMNAAFKAKGLREPFANVTELNGDGPKASGSDNIPVLNSPEEAFKLDPKIPTFKTPDGQLKKNPNFKPNASGAVEG